MARGVRGTRWLVPAWSLLLACLVLGPALAPGYVLTYDMVWVPDLALRPDFLGLGSGLPRAVPSDAVVAVLDEVVPGMVLQKAVLLGALVAAGTGTARLVPDAGAAWLVARLVAAGVAVWNPFVVERLVLGHWPVLVGYAVLPWVVLAARSWRAEGRLPLRLLVLLPLGSLSAGAGLVTALLVLLLLATRARILPLAGLLLAANAPWLVAGLLHASDAVSDRAGATAFALSDEGLLPGPLAALGLGGVWNAEVVPASRTGALAVVALVVLLGLAALGVRGWWRRTARREGVALVAAGCAGWVLAVLTWAAPDAVGGLAASVPGGGLLRDGARALALLAPLLAVNVAGGVAVLLARVSAAGPAAVVGLGAAVVLAPVALLPDAALGVSGRLGATTFPTSYDGARDAVADAVARRPADVLVLPATSYRQPVWNGGRKVLDPLGRYLTPDYVASDELVVSGVTIVGEDPRQRAAVAALGAPTPEERAAGLGALGVGVVVVDRTAPGPAPGPAPEVAGAILLDTPDLLVVELPAVDRRDAPASWVVATALAWGAWAGLALLALGLLGHRRRRGLPGMSRGGPRADIV